MSVPLPIYPAPPRYLIEDAEPRDLDPSCRDCKLGNDKLRTPCMPAAAVNQAKGGESMGTLLVVTASPSVQDDKLSRPLSGAEGAYLRKQLQAWNGVVVYDHALRCPIGKSKPTAKYYDACRGYLTATYKEAQPDRVILVGTEAVHAFTGRGLPTMSVRRGYGYLSDGTPAFITVPPGPAARNRFVREWLESDLEWAMTATADVSPRAPLDAIYYMVDSVEGAREAEEEIRVAGGLTGDLETFGHPFNEEQTILTAGITPFDEPVCYIWDKVALEDEAIRAPLLDVLADPDVPKGGQNWKFDCVHLQSAFGVVVRGTTFCTKLMTRIQRADADAKLENLQAKVGMLGGKDESKGYIDAGVRELRKAIRSPGTPIKLFPEIEEWKVDLALDRIRDGDEPRTYAYAAIPKDVRSRYCGTDCISTDRIRSQQEADMQDWQQRVWDGTARVLNDAIVQMECNGIAVSRDAISRLSEYCATEIVEHQAVLSQYAPPGFNPNSPAQVGKLLFETLGLETSGRTSTGGFKTDAAALEKLKHPAAGAILGLRKATKFKGQYADGMKYYIRDDGRIHPSINQDGTQTSRMSCSNPNLFNIPRPENERGVLARDVYVAPKGRRLIEVDYSQLELRVAAFLSGDEVMIDLFKRDVDFHLETAKLIAPIFGLNPDDIDKDHPMRSRAKTINFAVLYGDPVAGLAMKLGIHKNMAAKLQSAILGQFAALKKWIDECLSFGRMNGYCKTWWDGEEYHRRPLWRIADANDKERETAERSTWNTPVQGTGALFTNASIGRFQQVIEQKRLPALQVLTVYDSILIEMDEAAVDDVAGELIEVMSGWNSLGVPLKVDAKKGVAWGSMDKFTV